MSKNMIGMIGSMVFVGWALGCVIVPPYADKAGRRVPYLGAVAI